MSTTTTTGSTTSTVDVMVGSSSSSTTATIISILFDHVVYPLFYQSKASSGIDINSLFQSFFVSSTKFPADDLFIQQQEEEEEEQFSSTYTNNTTTTQQQSSSLLSPIPLPNWEYEIMKLQFCLILASILWLFVIPYYSVYRWTKQQQRQRRDAVIVVPTSTTTTTKYNMTFQKFYSILFQISYYIGVIPITIGIIIIGWIMTMIVINTLISPYNNSFVARRVFQTPLLTTDECQQIIQMGHMTAKKNVQYFAKYHPDDFTEEEDMMLYEFPNGWQKVRHASVPTTDLNLVTDPFTYEQQQYIVQQIGHVRIAPLLSRLYGIPKRSIRARDIFIVRYDGNSTSRFKLKKHTDGGDISFTIYLNTDFTGGGTQFWNRHTDQPFYLLPGGNGYHNNDTTVTGTTTNSLLQPGQFSTFPSLVEHEGYPTTEGIRYILVGFLDVVRYDEDGITPTGLSLYASYFNWNWLLARINDAWEKFDWDTQHIYYQKSIRKMIKRAIMKSVKLLDQYTQHSMTMPLIRQEQLPELIQILEQSYQNITTNRRSHKARWIEGQQKTAFVDYIKGYFSEDDDAEEEEDEDEGVEIGNDELVTPTLTVSGTNQDNELHMEL